MAWQQNPYQTGLTAGTEMSAGEGGRFFTLLESTLIHADPGDTLIDKGQPCYVSGGTALKGVAQTSAAAATDYLSIDTRGIYALSVVADNGAITIGDQLYIGTDGLVDNTSGSSFAFGIALGALDSAATGVIAVLLTGV